VNSSHSKDGPTAERGGETGRRGLLGAAIAAVGVGVAATATSCGRSETRVVEVSPRSVLPDLSDSADPQANSDALNSAITESQATGAEVIVPGGQYRFNGISIPSTGHVKIRGAGRGVTLLRNVGDRPSIAAHGTPGQPMYCSEWAVSDMTLVATRRRDNQAALSVMLAAQFSVRDVSIADHGVGVRHESGWDCGYDGVSVDRSGIAWQFPTSNYAPSSPVGLRNCSGTGCDTAVVIEDGVEALEWIGGDFSGCGRGLLLSGNQSRLISFHGINFERIDQEDVVIGNDSSGPAAVTFSGCRFLREQRGTVSVRLVRGESLAFYSSRWTKYSKAIVVENSFGTLVLTASTGFDVDEVVTSERGSMPVGAFNASNSSHSLVLSVDSASVLPAVTGSEGVATKVLSGQGRRTVADSDFTIAPTIGCMVVLLDEADGSIRHGIRGPVGWHVSEPYSPPAP
jgi:hypothetical protein